MEKTYLWRILTILLSLVLLGAAYLMNGRNILYLESISSPLFVLSMAMLLVSIILLFINDRIFLKWLRFAIVWVILSIILIALTPEYSGGWVPMNPDRESVSIWMGSLFVVLSLAKIIWDSWKEKK
ncbi:MAG: DUF202 domain-containing protein [Parcubacteria group bacterium]|jgi:fucose 4-O-acetylase-like acetyltransferase